MDAARRSIGEMQRRSLQGLSDLDNPEIDPTTGEPVPKKTLASIAAEQDTERKKALTGGSTGTRIQRTHN